MLLLSALALALCLAPDASTAVDPGVTATATAPWFVAPGGQRSGPYTNEQIAADYLAGRIDDTTLAWREGDAQWQPLSGTSGFADLDRWYIRQGEHSHGPTSGAQMRQMIADGRREGRDLSQLSVRVEWSTTWTALGDAVPLAATVPPARVDGTHDVHASSGRVPPTDAARRIHKLRIAGLVLVGVGGGLVVIGGGIAGGYSSGVVGSTGLWTGVALAGIGIGPAIAGFAMVGAANAKGRRLAERTKTARTLRASPLAGRGEVGLALGGRF